MTPDEHAEEAARLLDVAKTEHGDGQVASAMFPLAAAQVHALLTQRPAQREHLDGPSRVELIRELRDAVGLPTSASPRSPREEWLEAIVSVRQLARAVPSTGEDQSGDCVFTGCVLADGHGGPHVHDDEGPTSPAEDFLEALEDSVTKARAARKTECERGCTEHNADAACPKHGVAAFLGGRLSDEGARSDG